MDMRLDQDILSAVYLFFFWTCRRPACHCIKREEWPKLPSTTTSHDHNDRNNLTRPYDQDNNLTWPKQPLKDARKATHENDNTQTVMGFRSQRMWCHSHDPGLPVLHIDASRIIESHPFVMRNSTIEFKPQSSMDSRWDHESIPEVVSGHTCWSLITLDDNSAHLCRRQRWARTAVMATQACDRTPLHSISFFFFFFEPRITHFHCINRNTTVWIQMRAKIV